MAMTTVLSQSHDHEEHADHTHHLGFATGLVYVFEEDAFAAALHLHYTYLFEIGETHLGAGAGVETILDEHQHIATSVHLSYFPVHSLGLTIAPGILFTEGDGQFSLHLEASYEFILGSIHLGPVVEYAYAKDDSHLMFGLHVGLGF